MTDIDGLDDIYLQADMPNSQLPLPEEEFAPNELIGLGQFEQLPPYSLIEVL